VISCKAGGQDALDISAIITRKDERSARVAFRPEMQGLVWTDHVNKKSYEFTFRFKQDRGGVGVVTALRGGNDTYTPERMTEEIVKSIAA
jgi:hypothetical protein